ncbi:DUF924 family protein [Vannielia litorea]|uniref:DUF924 family protein n=1 Tax=Vannielia litorea TaxID=1217970 RepID=UPI001BCC6C31|nr:DUF924 family protein [Vannielia litorea]MBS8228610.1 DUF924 domain-containing protein [Vannielia litorea]
MVDAEDVVRFWTEDCGPEDWYKQDEALDEEIRRRFLPSWEAVAGGTRPAWGWGRVATLARLILVDQFPRNMFRGDGRSFATDGLAREWAKWAVESGVDKRVEGAARQFFYLPMMHSEVLADQDRSVRLFLARMPGSDNLSHARAHRQVIRDFGRFPYRNMALGRETGPVEAAYLEAGGYRWTLQSIDKDNGGSWIASG